MGVSYKYNGVEINSVNGATTAEDAKHILDSVKENGPHRLLIYGTARGLWEDRRKALNLINGRTHHVMTINDAAIHVMGHPINHIVSLHAEFPGAFRKIQEISRNLGRAATHCNRSAKGVDFVWDIYNVGGTSALFGAKIALAMGYKKIILCGCPLDNSGHYWEDPSTVGILGDMAIGMVWRDASHDYLKGYVKSMSGRTKDMLGEPDAEWLKEN